MNFKCNGSEWKIIEKETKILVDKYNAENEETTNFAFGVTIYPKHEIWINKDMCKSQKIKTLKHELTHCYIWNYGLYNVPHYTEEMVCDLVSSCSNFIYDIVNKYNKFERGGKIIWNLKKHMKR